RGAGERGGGREREVRRVKVGEAFGEPARYVGTAERVVEHHVGELVRERPVDVEEIAVPRARGDDDHAVFRVRGADGPVGRAQALGRGGGDVGGVLDETDLGAGEPRPIGGG